MPEWHKTSTINESIFLISCIKVAIYRIFGSEDLLYYMYLHCHILFYVSHAQHVLKLAMHKHFKSFQAYNFRFPIDAAPFNIYTLNESLIICQFLLAIFLSFCSPSITNVEYLSGQVCCTLL